MSTKIMKKNNVVFVSILFVLILFLVSIASLILYLEWNHNFVLYNIFLNIIWITAAITSFYILTNTLIIIKLLNGKKISTVSRKWVQGSLRPIYAMIENIGTLFKLDKNKIRSVFSYLNNQLILLSSITVKPEDILILLPHCLQRSSCPHKITTNIDNCKRCGACDIDKFIALKDQYSTKVYVATGGTLARKIIKDTKPKAIIAVACERDLSSGILDVKSIPVIGILNQRPEGPCVNTRVDLQRIKKTIEYFIKEGE